MEPMRSKTREEMVKIMKKIFKDGLKVKELRSDQGKEYTAKVVQEYLKTKNHKPCSSLQCLPCKLCRKSNQNHQITNIQILYKASNS